MPEITSAEIIREGDLLGDAVTRAAFDGAYQSLFTALRAVHTALTTALFLVRADPPTVDAQPQKALEASVSASRDAVAKLATATTGKQRTAAVTRSFEAVEAMKLLLPAALRALI